MEVAFLQKIVDLHKENKWKELLELKQLNCDNFDFRKLLWVWPTETNLEFIKSVISEFKLSGVISIGCGSGLFEWFLEQFSGFPVIGYEVNEEWWRSRYSSPQFIKLNFPKQPPTCDILNSNFALLFCYFNNGEAFREYIKCYKGDIVFIIGPGSGSGRHTDPEPFNPNFGDENWKLHRLQEVGDSRNFIAAYSRVNSQESH